MSIKTSFFKVENRIITKINDVNYTNLQEVDKFHFFFDDEWEELDKVLKICVKDKIYEYPILKDEVVIPREAYVPGFISIGINGVKGTRVLATGLTVITIGESAYDGELPDNMPTPTQWDLYIAELNNLLREANTVEEECEDLLAEVVRYRDESIANIEIVETLKNQTQAIKEQVDAQKEAIDDDIAEAESKLDTYNANYEQKLSEFNQNYNTKKQIIDGEVSNFESDYAQKVATFNSNAIQKTTDFNSNAETKTSDFNSNATTKKSDFNSNATTKTNAYNTNHTNKLKAYNDNHDDKLEEYNTNDTQKTTAYNTNATNKTTTFNNNYDTKLSAINSAGSTQVSAVNSAGTLQTSAVNSAGETQVSNVNSAGTTQTNAVNQAGQAKIDEINSNQTVQQVSDHEIRITRLEKASHIYGVKRARNNNSSSAWERTDDAVGLVANAQIGTTPVVNKFDGIKPWSNIVRKNIDILTGNTTAYYGEAEFKLDGSNGDVYTEIPDIYWKVWQDEDYDYIQIADGPMEGFTKTKSFDLQSYLTGYIDGKLRSYSGIAPARSTTIGAYRTRARALGNNFCLLDWRYFVIQLLYLVEYADYNSQVMLGRGLTSMRDSNDDKALIAEQNTNRIIINTSGGNAFIVGQTISIGETAREAFQVADSRRITAINDYDDGTIVGKEIIFDGEPLNIAIDNVIWSSGQHSGGCDFLGMKSGCLEDDGKHAVAYRGIENIFGNIFPFVDGINIKDGQAYICYDPAEYTSNKFESPYEAIGYVNAYNGNDNYSGYAKVLGFDPNHPLVRFPTELGGSTTTYMTDNYYASTGDRVARVGGSLLSGLHAGLWYWYLYYASSAAAWNCGARVLKYQ